MLSCGNDLLTCGNDLVSCGNDLLTCGNKLVSCGNDLLTCGNDLLSCGNEIKKLWENSSVSLPGLCTSSQVTDIRQSERQGLKDDDLAMFLGFSSLTLRAGDSTVSLI